MTRTLVTLAVAAAGLALAAPGHAATSIDRIYRGADGTIASFRQVGNDVYGFAENATTKRATVLIGTRSGSTISGEWYDIPKGTFEERGDFRFDTTRGLWRTGGDSFGPNRLTAVQPGSFPWPAQLPAGYQGTSNANLDGLYTADDGARWWVRQIKTDLFLAVGEREDQLGVRPDYTMVFVGRKVGSLVTGTWADVAKGQSSATGAMTFGTGPFRVLGVLGGGNRTVKLRPQYSVDFDLFAKTIEDKLKGNVVGFSYAIATNGHAVRQGAGGYRTKGSDGWRGFTIHTQSEAASTAKTVVAVATLKALASRGLTINTKVAPYLPLCWKRGPRIGDLTFRHLLTHTSELQEDGDTIGMSHDAEPFASLGRVIELGRTGPKNEYNNFNFRLLRILIPSLLAPANFHAWVEKRGCTKQRDTLNYEISSTFATYVFNAVLKPAGIEDGYGMPVDNHAFVYFDLLQRGKPVLGTFETSGSGILAISSAQYIRFLARLAGGGYGNGILETMQAELIGFERNGQTFKGNLGWYYTKNGGWKGAKTQAIIFPNGVQAYVMANSEPTGDSLYRVLMDAYSAALR